MKELTAREWRFLKFMCQRYADMTSTDWRLYLTDAYLGLEDARKRWDPSKALLTTFAARRVWGAIQDSMRTEDHLPRLHRQRLRQRANGEITPENERLPDMSQLPEYEDRENGRSVTRASPIHDETQRAAVRRVDMQDALAYVCDRLNPQEATVVRLLALGLNMREVSLEMEITESRVCQIFAGICKALGSNTAAQKWAASVLEPARTYSYKKCIRPIRDFGRSLWHAKAS